MMVHFSCCHLCTCGTRYSFFYQGKWVKQEFDRSLFARGNFYLWVCSLCACGTVLYVWKKQRKENVCVCDWTCMTGGLCECVMWLWDHFEPGGRWTTVNNISVPSLWPQRCVRVRGCLWRASGPEGGYPSLKLPFFCSPHLCFSHAPLHQDFHSSLPLCPQTFHLSSGLFYFFPSNLRFHLCCSVIIFIFIFSPACGCFLNKGNFRCQGLLLI